MEEQLQHLAWILVLLTICMACVLILVIGIYAAVKTIKDDWRGPRRD